MNDTNRRERIKAEKERLKRRIRVTVDPNKYEYIPEKKPFDVFEDIDTHQRVGIYARVSTDNVEQTSSYELQKKYYEEFVTKHPNWKLVEMRSIKDLLKFKGNINIYLNSSAVCTLFLKTAEAEGFTLGKDGKPTDSPYNDLIALHHDFTIAHHGYVGHLAFRMNGKMRPAVPTIWIDYAKYISGDRKYIIRRDRPAHWIK